MAPLQTDCYKVTDDCSLIQYTFLVPELSGIAWWQHAVVATDINWCKPNRHRLRARCTFNSCILTVKYTGREKFLFCH